MNSRFGLLDVLACVFVTFRRGSKITEGVAVLEIWLFEFFKIRMKAIGRVRNTETKMVRGTWINVCFFDFVFP